MVLDLTKIPMFQRDDNGPFTDDFVRKMVNVQQTQHGIVKYMEAMAQVMAEAAIASQKATNDSPIYAVDKWSNIVLARAKELIREKQDAAKKIEKGVTIDQEKP